MAAVTFMKSLLKIVLLVLLQGGATHAQAWPEPMAFGLPHSESAERVDHSVWQQLLTAYLSTDADAVSRFDYAAVNAADRALLQGYLDTLAATDPRQLNRDEQLAYWINLYNALTVAVVVDAWPVASIKRVRSPWLARGPWDDVLIEVAGQPLTLNDIEHRILRPVFRDNRIHYAVNCASLGCPDLATRVYEGALIDTQLDAAARKYVNHPRAVMLDEDGLRLSSIYKWYAADFGAGEAALREHIAGYARAELATALRDFRGDIRYDYDWAVNAPEAQ